jgi:hypothetical protein
MGIPLPLDGGRCEKFGIHPVEMKMKFPPP